MPAKTTAPTGGAANQNAAMFFLKADAPSENSGLVQNVVDRVVQFGQPCPAMTHCEMWIGEGAGEAGKPFTMENDNHFSTYLGSDKGAMWTSRVPDSRQFYGCGERVRDPAKHRPASAWSAIPIFGDDVAGKLRDECRTHFGTPYPSVFLLWHYPMSVWPLRAFAGAMDDRPSTPSHCAALSARILRAGVPNMALSHSSHWYGPSSLYLELSAPSRMERALARERPMGKPSGETDDEHEDRERERQELANTLFGESDDTVGNMSSSDAQTALHTLGIEVLRKGSRVGGVDVDQDQFREAQERYARGLCRYTWTHRVAMQS